MSELNPYYNGNDASVEPVLSIIYFDYIINELLPYLKRKYRISDDIYALGFNEGTIAATYLHIVNEKFYEDIETKFDVNKKIYLYKGDKVDGEITEFYNFYIRLEALKPISSKIDYVNDSDNTYSGFEKYLGSFIEYIEEK